jgi:proteic killer suppression protein
VILTIKHKGLQALYLTGSSKGVLPDHTKKLRRILAALDQARQPADMDLSGYRLHSLKGQYKGHWSVSVNGNWRVIWRFHGEDVELVDYLDYH